MTVYFCRAMVDTEAAGNIARLTQPTMTTTKVTGLHLHRFHDSLALAMRTERNDSIPTIYIPDYMLVKLRDALNEAIEDMPTTFTSSTFRTQRIGNVW